MIETPQSIAKAVEDLDNKTFRSHLFKIISIPVVMIVALLAFVHFQNSYRDSLEDDVEVYDQTILNSVYLEKIFAEMETGVRGYVISGKKEFLDPYKKAQIEIQSIKEYIFLKLSGDYSSTREFRALLENYETWFAIVKKTVTMKSNGVRAKNGLWKDLAIEAKTQFDLLRKKSANFRMSLEKEKGRLSTVLKDIVKLTNLLEILFALAFAIFIGFMVTKQLKELTRSYHSLLKKNSKSLAEAAESSRSKDLFLANMSHEIRTPLGAIMGFADLVSQNESLDSESLSHMAFIQRNSRHLLGLIDDLFDLSKATADKLEVYLERFDIKSISEDLHRTFRSKLADKKIILEMRADNKIPQFIKSDPTRLRQILSNLIGNAIKFSPKKSKIDVVFSFENTALTIDVIDRGIGIAGDVQGRIFEAFSQADSLHSREFGGAGLGLSISKRLATILGGELKLVSSQLNIGSHFRLTLPLENVDSNFIGSSELGLVVIDVDRSESNEEAIDLSGKHVLLAEDSKENQILFKIFIESSGSRLTIVDNGADAVREALANNFDLVLMDIQMPGLDGYEALKILRGSNFQKKIIALTAHTMKGEREKCLSAGFDDYISKPVSQNKLLSLMKASLVGS